MESELLDVRECGEISQTLGLKDLWWWTRIDRVRTHDPEPFDEWEQPHLFQLPERYKPRTPLDPLSSIESDSVVKVGKSCDVPGTTRSGTGFESLCVEFDMGDDHFNELLW